ncbi:hypothetical protein K440DRAFT_331291 [Wilcoxina mikolae CBS 423.85]|nr:hypothetical protein K440DRAFT_331291 [Wilcoxina mikolae CBS 423.85]
MQVFMRVNDPPPAGLPLSIEGLPTELLVQIACILSQKDLQNFIKSNPRSSKLRMLQGITLGSKHFAPWRRRWEFYTRAREAAVKEAEDKTWKAQYETPTVDGLPAVTTQATIVSSSQVLNKQKGPKELDFENVMSNIFENYGFPHPVPRNREGPMMSPNNQGRDMKRVRTVPARLLFPTITEGYFLQ